VAYKGALEKNTKRALKKKRTHFWLVLIPGITKFEFL